MKTIAISAMWLISGAGFLYYPRVIVVASAIFNSQLIHSISFRKSIKAVLRAPVLIAISFPVCYVIMLKMSRQAFEDRLIFDAWLWMVPPFIFSTVVIILFRKKSKTGNHGSGTGN